MNSDELKQYAQENGERFWNDAGTHWLNDKFDLRAYEKVIEVGGYLGDWTDYIQGKYECFVDTYEPVREYWERMITRFSNRSKITVHNYAVEAFDGEAHIAVMDDGSSMFDGGVSSGPVVRVVDIDRIVVEMYRVSLLALNCEGAEYNILDRLLFTGNIWRVDELLVQFHTFVPDAFERRDAIRKKLAKTHSEVMAYPFCWELWRIHGPGT